jgi:hypothetical protein
MAHIKVPVPGKEFGIWRGAVEHLRAEARRSR